MLKITRWNRFTFPEEKEIIFAIWEESGGHTFNLFNIKNGNLTSEFPIIGDKYPVPAILVLCALLEMNYDFNKYIEKIGRGRTTLSATDLQKIQYIDNLTALIGKKVPIDGITYKVDAFSDMKDSVDVVYLQSENSVLFIRPSGTGPNIRIYVFGPLSSFEKELSSVVNFVKNSN